MDLDSVVDELYGMDPAEFTSRRDQLASEARKEGDRELAGAIKALRRPSAAAYTVNLMARVNGDEIGRLIDLGARMREAQAALSGEELRALGRQRSQLVASLAQEARRAARDAGHPISEATEREVQATLEAALADEAAGEAVRAGRIVKALERSGMEPVDLEGAVAMRLAAGSAPTRAPRQPQTEKGRAERRGNDHKEQERGARLAEEHARAVETAEQAEAEAGRAETRRTEASEERDRAKRGRDDAEHAVHGLEEQLVEARAVLDRALEREIRARRALAEAEDDADKARSAARRARAEVDSLGP